jgi:hypothetical protein
MNTLRAALVPGLIAGLVSILISWLLMGGIFHQYQKATPDTWQPEGALGYTLSILLHVVASIGIACLFTLMVRFNVPVFAGSFRGSVFFAVSIWGAIALPMILESALFIRIHRLVVLGRILDWLATSLLACVITGWWLGK